jgi:hypothetical protein
MGILAPKNTLSLYRGTSKTLKLRVTSKSSTGTLVPVDLTGSKLYFTVKVKICDSLPLIQKTSDIGGDIDIVEPRSGIAHIYLSPVDTYQDTKRQYVYDVWVVLTSGKRYPVIPPTVLEVLPAVTDIPL